MRWPQTKEWTPWFNVAGQLGGFEAGYGNYTLTTFRAAGHSAVFMALPNVQERVVRFVD
jgi:hypothetical protein